MNYRSGSAEDIDAAVAEMQSHNSWTCRVLPFEDTKRLLFGWRCACGDSWVFQLLPFKQFFVNSKWRDEMSTVTGRRSLSEMIGCAVVRNER